ncbi:cob(I)yrinic acid a,c-diamide adenosyltransferase [Salisediminibacterium selenitireducens]|uniref:Corrinoid adenosyltransferase n=1 Tax=Bacillus selenitireducens (strain ATCC 700615 / DSM 15326 / MLS10) TaxID=439292 RepID=D6XVD8_BACIE|nr:cob(I)yrinic acid a,c-diamide adenosyltransferase [Salisediminibacterium selenitireducens]ADH99676.1 ATP/cobalamin adenosyltransferase [[Bacillus] selenitireducens MLS10]
MKIYTKSGDEGNTHLIGKKVPKTDMRVEAYGTVDELNSLIGVTLIHLSDQHADIRKDLKKIQQELFDLGGDLANVTDRDTYYMQEAFITDLEDRIDVYWEESPPLERFILPGGQSGAAYLHQCRTVARRAERRIVDVAHEEQIPPAAIPYMNRLSDYFFSASRVVNVREGYEDTFYDASRNQPE